MEAAKGGQSEVQLADLAASKASSDAVKGFAQKIKDDHTQANQQLEQIASNKGVKVATEPNEHTQIAKKLEKLSGPAFDKAYVQHMVQDHQKDVSTFQAKAKNAKDQDVKQFASNTLPTLQDHLKRAKEVQNEIGATGSTKGGKASERTTKTSRRGQNESEQGDTVSRLMPGQPQPRT
jgi:putative membrane protein